MVYLCSIHIVLLTGVGYVVGTEAHDEYSADLSQFAISLTCTMIYVLTSVMIMVLNEIPPHCVSAHNRYIRKPLCKTLLGSSYRMGFKKKFQT